MSTEGIRISGWSNASLRIIAAGIVIAFCYWAGSMVMTLLLSVLLAYFLDPVVEWLERFRIPRALGALLVLLVALAMLGGLTYLVFDRLEHFVSDWPRYSTVIKKGAATIDEKLEQLESRVSELRPKEPRGRTLIRVGEESPVRGVLLRGLGSLYTILLTTTFVPFLVFFMLAAKRTVWHSTLQLFPASERTRVKEALEDLSLMLRSYVAGNALVAGTLALASWGFFWIMDLEYAFLAGVASGLLNLVPYLGAPLAWLPPFVIGLSKWKSLAPFLLVAGTLSVFHLIAINVLMPALVGRRVHLNALAVTMALLFWGWLWGAAGLLLAIPITATIKVVCDNVEGWRPVGRWLGA